MARLFGQVGQFDQRMMELLSPYPTLPTPDDPEAKDWVTHGRDNLRGHDSEPNPAPAPQTPADPPPGVGVETEPARSRPDRTTLSDVGHRASNQRAAG